MSKKSILVAVASCLLLTAVVTPAHAAKGGRFAAQSVGSCSVEGNVVHGTGLPTDELINFLLTPEGGSTWGWVLGHTDEGTWSVAVPARDGETRYEFVSRTWGPNGSKYTVFASCSAS